ncbi:Leucine-responsive regulatory protein [BD1-7 clade bacterium]|uniref:Leucine-responsive regulatory protein n=1 Tax=BD1-7 clade bacterium TaxID=2029982 RepID=A0A5S9QUQ2_9GAMM|nr:Leucine-responsive regulatory protein [BD1-7 clade bacterium]CAA0122241.1 Leucine-responsive regulatory protein [BD1-7 clade bacterium]
MDRIDRRILQELQGDGRMTNAQLAETVGLSASACLRRVQELERLGVIVGYRAIVDPLALGRGFTVLVAIGLDDHSKRSQRAFESAVVNSPEVVECHNVTGAIEYLLRVEVADLAHYKRFHTDVLGTLPQVHSISSYVVMESIKDERA